MFSMKDFKFLVLGIWKSQLTFHHLEAFGVELERESCVARFPFQCRRVRVAALPDFVGVCPDIDDCVVPDMRLELVFEQFSKPADNDTAKTMGRPLNQLKTQTLLAGDGRRTRRSHLTVDELEVETESDREELLEEEAWKKLERWKKVRLVQVCLERGLSTKGTKATLKKRLVEHGYSPGARPATSCLLIKLSLWLLFVRSPAIRHCRREG